MGPLGPAPAARGRERAAERFHRALAERPIEVAQPLPQHFRPLARAIVGDRAVSVRTGPATRAALAAAGKPAATVGNVIHLRRSLDRSLESVEVLAHELVHAARPSPQARFFGDDRRSAEEHVAEHTGRLARALVASEVASPPRGHQQDRLAWGTSGLPVGSLGGAAKTLSVERAAKVPVPPTIAPQRRVSSSGSSSLVERTADLFRQAGTSPATANGGRSATIATSPGSITSAMSASNLPVPRPGDGPIVRHNTWSGVQRFTTVPSTVSTTSADVTSDRPMTVGGVDVALFDALVDALEQRVIDELERRGLRHNPGVF
ncbi:MAG: eCIS core domain-containing protein [Acidimicrobiales bacterium]